MKKAKITRIKVEYNVSDGGLNGDFEKVMRKTIKSFGLKYDGSGMNLETRSRDLYWYEK